MPRSAALWVVGLGLIVAGALLPGGWYHPLAPQEALPAPPLSGALLVQLCLVVDGLVLLAVAIRGWSFHPLAEAERAPLGPPETGQRSHLLALAGITALGLGLRLYQLDSDLWLDEIAPLLLYRDASALEVVTSYVSSNNHLMNALLVKVCASLWGDHAWAVRLPAVVFGAASVPALYWLSRGVLSSSARLAAALLLAVSYHHVFFSQNARGYTGYVFFSLLATGLLLEALRTDTARSWILYLAAMVLDLGSHGLAAFVLAAHALTGVFLLVSLQRSGAAWRPLAGRLTGMFALAAFLVFQLYAAQLPQAWVYIRTVYADPSVGSSPLSMAFVTEVLNGLAGGWRPWLLAPALLGLPVVALGARRLWQRSRAFGLALLLPALLQFLAVAAGGLAVSPRFFLLLLPCGILVGLAGLEAALDRFAGGLALTRAGLGLAVTLGLGAAAISLPRYYQVPKQAYRASLEHLRTLRDPQHVLIAIHLMREGYRYYAPKAGLTRGVDYFDARTVAELDAVLGAHAGQTPILVTTLPHILHLALPELEARIQRDWVPEQTFPGTIGDGDITVWSPR